MRFWLVWAFGAVHMALDSRQPPVFVGSMQGRDVVQRRKQMQSAGVLAELLVAVLVAVVPVEVRAEGDPATAVALVQAAKVLSAEGRLDEAIGLAKKAYEFDPKPDTLMLLGRYFERQEEWQQARKAYLRVIETDKDPAKVASANQRLDALLDRLPGTLIVETEPPGAALTVDGKPVSDASQPVRIEVLRGRHQVVARLRLHAEASQSVEVQAEEEVRVRLVLRPTGSRLMVTSEVPGASVSVDGEVERALPLERPFLLEEGQHMIEVRAPGHETALRVVDIGSGETLTMNIRLMPTTPALAAPVPAPAPAPAPPAAFKDRRTEPHSAAAPEHSSPSQEHPEPVGAPLSIAKESRPQESVSRESNVIGHVAITAGEGLLAADNKVRRTHVTLEALGGVRWQKVSWLQFELGIAVAPEGPAMVLLRPGVRMYVGRIPVFLRVAGQAMVTPVVAGGMLVGVGGNVPLGKGFSLPLEVDASLWPSAIRRVPVEFRAGLAYEF